MPKPRKLTTLNKKDRIWFGFGVTLCIVLVLAGWLYTLKGTLAPDIEKASTQLEEVIDKAQDRYDQTAEDVTQFKAEFDAGMELIEENTTE